MFVCMYRFHTLILAESAGMGLSADYQKGLTAYERGDYATALREWTPLAEQGHATFWQLRI